MIFRNCAGGVVFYNDRVFILKNEKNEWVLPKGKIRNDLIPSETAISRVKYETGLDARIVSTGGETCYEFYSITRNQSVYNKVTWYVMEAENEEFKVNHEEGFQEGNFYDIEKALEMITHNQDKSLVNAAYKRYLEFKDYEKDLVYA